MKTTPVDDLTVKEIADAAGVTRQTFYRNFLDKYDLINWYFEKLLMESFARMGDGKTIYDGLTRKFEFIRNEQVFFAAAFRSDDRNSLKEHDYELILNFYQDLIRKKTGRIPEEEILFQLKLYCRGSIHMTVEWLLSEKKCTPKRMATLLVNAMPRKLEELFRSLDVLGTGIKICEKNIKK
ncbi:MAG: TetR/AcrR family transcriptional regulator [Lachnospiraceae bacterium]|nr:TetR/AcrR family transcriptional regulator [Lachnospiraceae bacterium]